MNFSVIAGENSNDTFPKIAFKGSFLKEEVVFNNRKLYRAQVLGIVLLYELLNLITVNSIKILFFLLEKTLRIQKLKGRSELIVL